MRNIPHYIIRFYPVSAASNGARTQPFILHSPIPGREDSHLAQCPGIRPACPPLALAETGAFAEGISRGEEAIRIAEAADHPYSLVNACWGFSYLYIMKGDFQKARPLMERAVELCRVGQAENHYQQALTLANELGMCPLQAHCHRDLGTLYHQTGQPEQARAELSTAIDMYREMEMTFWLPEAESGLADVEGKA